MKLPKIKLDWTTGALLVGGILVAGYILLEETEPGKPFRNTIDQLAGNPPSGPPQEEYETAYSRRMR